jgi:hypothetical protein
MAEAAKATITLTTGSGPSQGGGRRASEARAHASPGYPRYT